MLLNVLGERGPPQSTSALAAGVNAMPVRAVPRRRQAPSCPADGPIHEQDPDPAQAGCGDLVDADRLVVGLYDGCALVDRS